MRRGRRKQHLKTILLPDSEVEWEWETGSGLPPILEEEVVDDNDDFIGDVPRIIAVISCNPKAQQTQDKKCYICNQDLDFKPSWIMDNNDIINNAFLQAGNKDNNNNIGSFTLDALCTLGHGFDLSVQSSKDNRIDKGTMCKLCPECVEIVEDAKELKEQLEELKNNLEMRVVTLGIKLEQSLNWMDQRQDVKGDMIIKKVKSILKRAFGPASKLGSATWKQTPVGGSGCSSGTRTKNENADQVGEGRSVKLERFSGTLSIDEDNVPSSFDFNGHKIFTVPKIKQEYDEKPSIGKGGMKRKSTRRKNVRFAPEVKEETFAVNEKSGRQSLRRSQRKRRMKIEINGDGDVSQIDIDEEESPKPLRRSPRRSMKREIDDDEYSPRRKPSKKRRMKSEISDDTPTVNDDQESPRRMTVVGNPRMKKVKPETINPKTADAFQLLIQDVKTDVARSSRANTSIAQLASSGDAHWLTDNLEPAEKGVVMRCTLYRHYFDHCIKTNRVPPNRATFGKLVRRVFLAVLKTRRLGTRGNSRYCYTGIRIKPDSALNDVVEEYDVEDQTDTQETYEPKQSKKRGKKSLLVQLGIKPPQAPKKQIILGPSGPTFVTPDLSIPLQWPVDLDTLLSLPEFSDSCIPHESSPSDILKKLLGPRHSSSNTTPV